MAVTRSQSRASAKANQSTCGCTYRGPMRDKIRDTVALAKETVGTFTAWTTSTCVKEAQEAFHEELNAYKQKDPKDAAAEFCQYDKHYAVALIMSSLLMVVLIRGITTIMGSAAVTNVTQTITRIVALVKLVLEPIIGSTLQQIVWVVRAEKANLG